MPAKPMFVLNSSEESHTFFKDHLSSLMLAVERGIRASDDCDEYFNIAIVGDAIKHPNTYRTPRVHYCIATMAEQIFAEYPGVEVNFGPNHSLVLVFNNLAQVRFQKMNDDFTFPTTNRTKRETDFRNPSSADIFGQFPLECVYAAYRLRSSGELRDLYLVGMDHNEGQWFLNVGRSIGEDPLNIPFGQQPVAPVINPNEADELLRPRKKNP